MDPAGLFHPLVVLPHFIIANTKLLDGSSLPESFAELLEPKWEGKVFLGAAELPSAKSVLFSMWYLFGDEGLEICVKNWRQKSAPSAARHGLVKDEFPIAFFPGIFGGPGPDDKLVRIQPREGASVLPSYAAVKRSTIEKETLEFLKASALHKEFIEFYRTQALAYPADPAVDLPENLSPEEKMFFPEWEWILSRDMEYFTEACRRVPWG
jgi:ABC-type Fe3+ transport system substrate-binding protein